MTTLFATLLPFAGLLRANNEATLEKTVVRLAERATPRTALVYGAIGLGSGAVVDPDGTTVTNAHVGLGARVALLEFSDGRKVKARRRGMDLERDLAIYEPIEKLKEPAPCFELARSRPEPGAWLVALGFPGGPRGDMQPTVSLGKCIEGGGLKGPVMGILRYDDAVRTDIAIFSGNSGGPLLDLEGRLVGINGAMEIGSGAAFAVPIEIVRDRLASLKDGALRLPGGTTLGGKSSLLRLIDKALEPATEKMVERVKEGFAPKPRGGDEGPIPKAIARTKDELVKKLRETPREKGLAAELHGLRAKDLCVKLDDRHLATRVDRRHVVAKASFLGDKKDWSVSAHAKARVVSVDAENDLALLELADEADVKLVEDAGSRPAGSLCAALGPDGLLAAGIVSVSAREIPAAVSARIASGGMAASMIQMLRRLEALSPRLKEAFEPMIEQLEQQESINAGNEPRGYGHVLSHDAPLAPGEAGAPLVDAEGRLIGVNVSNANYGTSYAVPIGRVREIFGLKSAERRAKSKLY